MISVRELGSWVMLPGALLTGHRHQNGIQGEDDEKKD